MKRAHVGRLTILVIVWSLISGCYAAVCPTPNKLKFATADVEAHAKEFRPDANAALVYVFREKEFRGCGFRLGIRIAEESGGWWNKCLEIGQFAMWSVKPGRYIVTKWEDFNCVRLDEVDRSDKIRLEVHPGRSYFIRARTYLFMMGEKLKVVSEEYGKDKVSDSQMVR